METFEEHELVPIAEKKVSLGVIQASSAQGLLDSAVSAANVLKPVIEQRKLYVQIGKKKYVVVEGWTTLAVMCGCAPREVHTEKHDNGAWYESTVELVRLDDERVISRASAECGGPDEPEWMTRYNKKLNADEPRPPFERRSMAITRATGKVCRLSLSWIMALAGYETTPYEEMAAARGVIEAEYEYDPPYTPPDTTGSPVQPAGQNYPKKMPTKIKDAKCRYCQAVIHLGEDIAYYGPGQGPPAHWSCHEGAHHAGA